MALEPKLSICFKDNCKELQLTDTTGTYSATNTGGWGAPNITLASVDEAVVSILLPNTTTEVEVDVTDTVIAATIVDGEFLLDTLTMDGDFDGDEDEKFPDGIYEFTYTITESGTEYEFTATSFSTCQVACCIEKMKTKFQEKLCGCDWEQYWKNYLLAKALLMGAKSAFACGDTTKAENLLESIEKICGTNCDC